MAAGAPCSLLTGEHMKIKATRNTSASGVDIRKGETYSVPADLSEADARLLVRIRKAALIEDEEDAEPKAKAKGGSKAAGKTGGKAPAKPADGGATEPQSSEQSGAGTEDGSTEGPATEE